MVRRTFAGEPAPPLVRGVPERRLRDATVTPVEVPRAASGARELVVERVVRETRDAITLVLRDPSGAPIAFEAGQFFTLLASVDGEVVPRNYSASNAPGWGELCLTIKRKAGGRVSGRLFELRRGERVRVLGPFGQFTLAAAGEVPRRILLVAGGAGITPVASIARAALASRDVEVALVYGNRREEDVVFASELDELARAHAPRLVVRHVLEDPPAGWDGATGRLDRATVARVLDDLGSLDGAVCFVCGPDGMRDEVVAALAARGVPDEAVKVERFAIGPRPQVAAAPGGAGGARSILVRTGARAFRAAALPGATLLEAGLAAGAPMPSSCAVGGCGACRVRLVSGEVEMEEPNCLSARERAAGYVLACVGRPQGACEIEIEAEEAR